MKRNQLILLLILLLLVVGYIWLRSRSPRESLKPGKKDRLLQNHARLEDKPAH